MKFILKNKISELNKLAAELEKFSAGHNLSKNILFDINLALDELVTNIISYGFEENTDHEIIISIDKKEDRVDIILEDDGKEFNPLNEKEPEFGGSIDEREIGGLGIYFVKQKMNSVDYERQNNKNILRLVKQI